VWGGPPGARDRADPVEISGVAIDGKMLDFLIGHYLIPQFPETKIGRPFELAHRVDRLEIAPNAVGVVMGDKKR
jgi:hypothetical protein